MTRKTWFYFVCAFAALLFLDAWIFRAYLSPMYPFGDELALRAAASSGPFNWIHKGFSDYFVAYPEWFRPFTNFLRPVVNLTYYLFQWDETGACQVVLVNHAIHVGITLTLFALAWASRLSLAWCLAVGLAGFLAPGFGATIMPIAPAFAFDGLVALLSLGGLFAIARERVLPGLLLLLLAALTKEAALPVVMALLMFGLITRRGGLVAGAAGILLLWLGLRHAAFGSVLGGVYVYGDGSAGLSMLKKFQRPHVLPFGASQVFYYPMFVGEGERHVLREFYQVFTLVLLWGMFRQLRLISLCRQAWRGAARSEEAKAAEQLFLIAALASILYLILIGSEARFAYTATVLTLAWLASAAAFSRARAGLLAGMVVGGGVLSIAYTSALLAKLDMQRANQASSQQLLSALRQHPVGPMVYTVADFSSRYAAGDHIRRYAGVTREVARGLSIDVDRCAVDQLAAVRTEVRREAGGVVHLDVTLPDCAAFTWEAVAPDLMMASLHGQTFVRNKHLQYTFPGLLLSDNRGRQRVASFGQRALLTMTGAGALVYRPVQQQWELIE